MILSVSFFLIHRSLSTSNLLKFKAMDRLFLETHKWNIWEAVELIFLIGLVFFKVILTIILAQTIRLAR